jgi:hypothetical protein
MIIVVFRNVNDHVLVFLSTIMIHESGASEVALDLKFGAANMIVAV